MNIYLNGNLAQVSVIHINVLLTPNKKRLYFLWSQRCFTLYKTIAIRLFVLQGSKQ